MSHASQSALGLDVGTSRIVIARRAGDDFRFESQLNAFVAIPYSKITEGVLDREKVPHTVQSGQIIVHGNESEKFAELMNTEMRRTMTRGTLDAKEPESLSMMRHIITSLAGSASQSGKICFTATYFRNPPGPVTKAKKSSAMPPTASRVSTSYLPMRMP